MNTGEFPALVTEDGTRLLLDYPKVFKAFYRQFAGHEVILSLRRKRSKRSERQNAAFHAALTRWVVERSARTGEAVHVAEAVEQLKDDLLALRWGYIVRQNVFTGEIVKRLVKPHTSKLSTSEFSEIFELAAEEAAKDGHVMEMPDEFNARKASDAKRAKRKAA